MVGLTPWNPDDYFSKGMTWKPVVLLISFQHTAVKIVQNLKSIEPFVEGSFFFSHDSQGFQVVKEC